jgi:hypothetical protein
MWIVWIEIQRPHMWDRGSCFSLDIGFIPITEIEISVERIGKTYPQAYPQGEQIFILSTSWNTLNTVPISGGVELWIILALWGLLHSERRLSTKNRELSTDS